MHQQPKNSEFNLIEQELKQEQSARISTRWSSLSSSLLLGEHYARIAPFAHSHARTRSSLAAAAMAPAAKPIREPSALSVYRPGLFNGKVVRPAIDPVLSLSLISSASARLTHV